MERKWIEHDGLSVPVPIGTRVDIRRQNGDEVIGHIVGFGSVGRDGITRRCALPTIGRHTSWIWETSLFPHVNIIAYRRHDTPESEAERAAERMTEFRKHLRSAAPLVRGKVGV
jgi:hypothetical protein